MNESQYLAIFIDAWRLSRGLTGNDFTARAEVSNTLLTMLRRGADPRLTTLAKVASAMDLTLLELLDNAGLGGPESPGSDAVVEAVIAKALRDDGQPLDVRRDFVAHYRRLLSARQQASPPPLSGPGPVSVLSLDVEE